MAPSPVDVRDASSEDQKLAAIRELCNLDFRAIIDRKLSSVKRAYVHQLGPDPIRRYVARASQSIGKPGPLPRSQLILAKSQPPPALPAIKPQFAARPVIEEEEEEEEGQDAGGGEWVKEEEDGGQGKEEDVFELPSAKNAPARDSGEVKSWNGITMDEESESERSRPSGALPFEFASGELGEPSNPPQQQPVADEIDEFGNEAGIFGTLEIPSGEMQGRESGGSDEFGSFEDTFELAGFD
jgi:hypothetical protein